MVDRRRSFPLCPVCAAVTLLAVLVLAGCTRPPWPPIDDEGPRVLRRLETRAEETQAATYRVRWRSIGTEPHAVFFLDIAYQAPDRFRVTAEGPFGIPAFTSVVVADTFWFVDHRSEELTTDLVENLGDYAIPMADFFAGTWRALFSGGWGVRPTTGAATLRLRPGKSRGEYKISRESTRWTIKWKHGREVPRWIRAETQDDGRTVLVAETWYHRYSDTFPYWEMESLRISGFPGGGEHRWKILRQKHPASLPDRIFEPLSKPR